MNFINLISLFGIFLNTNLFIKGVESTDNQLHFLVLLKYLDVNTLSRLIAFKQYIDPKRYDLRPRYPNGWLYHVKLIDRWTRRLGMYGYGITALNSYGDANCMFNTLYTIFHLNNLTNKRLLEILNPDLEPAVEIAIRGLLESEEPIKPLNIKRIGQIVWLGTDPYDKESADSFELEPLLKRMESLTTLQEVYPDKKLGIDGGTMFENVDIINYYKRLTTEKDKIRILKEMWDEFELKRYNRFGDYKDKTAIEMVFEMFIINLNKKNTEVSCGSIEYKYTPKFVILMLYEDRRHYDVGGLFKLGNTDEKKIKTLYKISEIPMPLLLFMAEDCRLRRKPN